MSNLIKKIRTQSGDAQIDYESLANLPAPDKSLTQEGKAADAKEVGDRLGQLSDEVANDKQNKNFIINIIGKTTNDGVVIHKLDGCDCNDIINAYNDGRLLFVNYYGDMFYLSKVDKYKNAFVFWFKDILVNTEINVDISTDEMTCDIAINYDYTNVNSYCFYIREDTDENENPILYADYDYYTLLNIVNMEDNTFSKQYLILYALYNDRIYTYTALKSEEDKNYMYFQSVDDNTIHSIKIYEDNTIVYESKEYLLAKQDVQYAGRYMTIGNDGNVDSSVDSKILEQVGKPNNLYGRRVYMIGDSNMDNWNTANRELFEQRYGCTVQSFAEYGATFEVRDGNGTATTARGSAVGQWNLILQNEPIDSETLMLPEDIAIFFMMGTNCGTKGTEANRSDMDVTTALGAMEWVFTQISYYCRGDIPVGVILPVQSGVGHANIIWSAERHGFPYINIEKHGRQIQDNINSSIKAESFIVTGNHIANHGWKHFRRIVHNWMAYNV